MLLLVSPNKLVEYSINTVVCVVVAVACLLHALIGSFRFLVIPATPDCCFITLILAIHYSFGTTLAEARTGLYVDAFGDQEREVGELVRYKLGWVENQIISSTTIGGYQPLPCTNTNVRSEILALPVRGIGSNIRPQEAALFQGGPQGWDPLRWR